MQFNYGGWGVEKCSGPPPPIIFNTIALNQMINCVHRNQKSDDGFQAEHRNQNIG